MKKFIVRRVLLGAMILFFVSMIIYSIERALPTSYVEGRARDMSMKQGAKPYDELVAELNASYGLDKPVLEGYFIWLGKAVHGEFGESWIFHQPVKQKFASVIWYSFALHWPPSCWKLSLPYLWVLYRQRSSTAGLIMQSPFLH